MLSAGFARCAPAAHVPHEMHCLAYEYTCSQALQAAWTICMVPPTYTAGHRSMPAAQAAACACWGTRGLRLAHQHAQEQEAQEHDVRALLHVRRHRGAARAGRHARQQLRQRIKRPRRRRRWPAARAAAPLAVPHRLPPPARPSGCLFGYGIDAWHKWHGGHLRPLALWRHCASWVRRSLGWHSQVNN